MDKCFSLNLPKSLIYRNFLWITQGIKTSVEALLLAWGARGREFESRHADHFSLMKSTGYSSQSCNPFFFVGLIPVLATLLATPFYRMAHVCLASEGQSWRN